MRLRAVLFDLDNTLLDFLGMKRHASREAARAMESAGARFPWPLEETAQRLYDFYLDRNIEGNDVFMEFARRHAQVGLATVPGHPYTRLTAAAINAYLRAKEVHLRPYPGVPRTLIALMRRGLKLGIVTDAPRLKAYQRLDSAGLFDHFDVVVTPDDAGHAKPHPAIFEAALERLGVRGPEALMVGDRVARDLDGGRSVGMRTALAAYGASASEQGPADHVLLRFEDLVPICDELTDPHVRSPAAPGPTGPWSAPPPGRARG